MAEEDIRLEPRAREQTAETCSDEHSDDPVPSCKPDRSEQIDQRLKDRLVPILPKEPHRRGEGADRAQDPGQVEVEHDDEHGAHGERIPRTEPQVDEGIEQDEQADRTEPDKPSDEEIQCHEGANIRLLVLFHDQISDARQNRGVEHPDHVADRDDEHVVAAVDSGARQIDEPDDQDVVRSADDDGPRFLRGERHHVLPDPLHLHLRQFHSYRFGQARVDSVDPARDEEVLDDCLEEDHEEIEKI